VFLDHLDIELVKDIDRESADARAAGFDDLVIPTRYRDLLVALVDNHASGLQRGIEKTKHASMSAKPTQIDIVRGKGQGLIILLHGPPGSGKTSTAETIAAYTQRPLYSITCGDIGTDPIKVEQNLLEHTRRADKWGCVLLLDEADVFLVQRDW
jgi:DNA-binding NtrC family response regulator